VSVVLNAASAYFDGGLVALAAPGEFWYVNTRNNVPGRATQKGVIRVASVDWMLALIFTGAAVAGALLLTLAGFVLLRFCAQTRPLSAFAQTRFAVHLYNVSRTYLDRGVWQK